MAAVFYSHISEGKKKEEIQFLEKSLYKPEILINI